MNLKQKDAQRAETAPEVNYLADDRLHVTMPVLVEYLLDARAALMDAQERAYKAGQEDWSDDFAEILDHLLDVLPCAAIRDEVGKKWRALADAIDSEIDKRLGT